MRRSAVPIVFAASLGLIALGQNAQPTGSVHVHRIESKALGETRVVRVYTPPGYDASTALFPVLYQTDGEFQLDNTVATAEFLAAVGRIPRMIVVAIHNTDRYRDLTPTDPTFHENGRDKKLPNAGGADRFLDFIAGELIPLIESEYRTAPFRIFDGHSLGGMFSLYTFLTRTDLFNGYIAISATYPYDDKLILRKAREFFDGRKSLDRTLFFTLGDEPLLEPGFQELQRILRRQRASGFSWGARQFKDEDHSSVVLLSHYYGLRKIFEDWPLPVDPKTGQFPGGVAELKKHYESLSSRLGYTIVPPEARMNFLGYTLLGENRIDLALEIFRMNVANYPGSANAHDSLGDGLSAAGQLAEAKEQYAAAVRLGEAANDPSVATYREHLAAAEKKLAEPKRE